MSFGKIRIDLADKYMSQWVRLRDGKCTRCGSLVHINDKGLPVSHHASHFWSRRKENTRFDEINVTTHCHGCHSYLTANPAEHRAWKLAQIGQREYDLLELRANSYHKKDRESEKIYWRQRLREDYLNA